MNNFEYLNSLTIDELAEWLGKYCMFDDAPWTNWFGNLHCKNCEAIEVTLQDTGRKTECSYCELEHKCKYFPELGAEPEMKDIIKIWLTREKD